MTAALAALACGLRGKPAGSLPPFERPSSAIVVHKGWVFRRSDLRDDVGITPVASDAR